MSPEATSKKKRQNGTWSMLSSFLLTFDLATFIHNTVQTTNSRKLDNRFHLNSKVIEIRKLTVHAHCIQLTQSFTLRHLRKNSSTQEATCQDWRVPKILFIYSIQMEPNHMNDEKRYQQLIVTPSKCDHKICMRFKFFDLFEFCMHQTVSAACFVRAAHQHGC